LTCAMARDWTDGLSTVVRHSAGEAAVICLRVAGKLFHRCGPATVKLLSLKMVLVRIKASDRYEDERRWRPCSEA